MKKSSDTHYDAVIIGAGIGGLVCGCYLAKAGMKVLICEQHHKPGGYCTSFRRKSFTFDAAAHSFGGFRTGGIVRKAVTDCDLLDRLIIHRFDPLDIIVSPHHRLHFWTDASRTLDEFSSAFPDEKDALRRFYDFLIHPDNLSSVLMRNASFNDLLDHFFSDPTLKSIISVPLYGDGGLPPSRMSAFIGAKIFREFIIDGGYYPQSGMQALPDAFTDRFRELGGTLLLSSEVARIITKDNIAKGIELLDGRQFFAHQIISNCDSRHTFLKLIGIDKLERNFTKKLKSLIPSLSLFVQYMGVHDTPNILPPGANVWFTRHYNLDRAYSAALSGMINELETYMIRSSPDMKTILAFFNISYKTKRFWDLSKENVSAQFIRLIEETLVPDLASRIVYRESASPNTLHRYTCNYRGAAYGWACSPEQLGDHHFRKPPFIKNLSLVGHWTMQGLGIPGVIYTAIDTASGILKRRNVGVKDACHA